MSTSTPELLLGELAVKKGLATEAEVETALDLQKQVEPDAEQAPAKVGEILLEMGTFSEDDLQALLLEQSSLRQPAAPGEESPRAAARLVQESSDPVLVNGDPVTGPRALVQGDRVRIGETVLRFEGGEDLLLIPSKPVSPSGSTVEMPAMTPKPAAAAPPEPVKAEASAAPDGLKEKLKAASARGWEKLKRLFRDVTGKRAKEKAAAIERRDALLRELAETALAGGAAGPEAEAARKAKAAADEAEKKTGVAAKNAAKLAREKADRALFKLGRATAEKGADPAKLEELRALDAKVKDLS
jgi:hypothetical protein